MNLLPTHGPRKLLEVESSEGAGPARGGGLMPPREQQVQFGKGLTSSGGPVQVVMGWSSEVGRIAGKGALLPACHEE